MAGGVNGSFGDGGPASEAALNGPFSLAVDASGNLLIGDRLNNRVRRVDGMTETIDTVVGTGQAVDLGDSRPAFAATIKPNGVSIDRQDNIFLVEPEGNRVRRIDRQTGLISTFAGGCRDCELGDGGLATEARLSSPAGVVSSQVGDVFITDPGHARIRKVDATSGIITTIAGGGDPEDGFGDNGPALEAAFADLQGLAIDGAENLYTVDRGRIRKITTDGVITTVAGTGCQPGNENCLRGDYGPATEATLVISPFLRSNLLAADTRGNLYLAEEEFSRIRRVDAETGLITTVLGSGCDQFVARDCPQVENIPATQMGLRPKGIGVDGAGNLWVSGLVGSDETRMVDAVTGVITRVAGGSFPIDGVGDGGPALDAFFLQAVAAAFDSGGNLYVPDFGQGRLRGVRGVVPTGPQPHRSIVFVDNMEDLGADWTTAGSTGNQTWSLTTERFNNGAQAWFATNIPAISDQRLTLAGPISLPPDAIGVILTFWHRYDLETSFDGGVLETSIDGGANWVDAGGMMLGDGYDEELSSGFGNPLSGRFAFTG